MSAPTDTKAPDRRTPTREGIADHGPWWWLGEHEKRRVVEVVDRGGFLLYSDTLGTANWGVEHTTERWRGPVRSGATP